jgi:hypothetical protein
MLQDNLFKGFSLNIILNSYGNNTMGTDYQYNVTQSMNYCTAGFDCMNGIIKGMTHCYMSNQFDGNVVLAMSYVNTGSRFQNNLVLSTMTNSFFGEGFRNNSFTTAIVIQDLVVMPNIIGTDFSSSNVISWTCNKEVISRQDGAVRIRYIDNTDTVLVVDLTT